MSFLDGPLDAYSADVPLMRRLGLRTTGFDHNLTDLGTVTVFEAGEGCADTTDTPATTIKVEGAALPAMFWRFTISRPRDDVDGTESETVVVETGSGNFREFWPVAVMVAKHMVTVRQVP